MNCGAAFIFDPQTEAALRAAWQAVADAGVSAFMLGLDYPPHMTVFMADAVDIDGLRASWKALASCIAPFPLTFPSLGVFGGGAGVVYLTPTIPRSLLDLHRCFWEAAQPYLQNPAPYYAPGQWSPHVTLAFDLSQGQVDAAITALLKAQDRLPRPGQIDGLIFGSFNLKGGSVLEKIYLSTGK
jgi:2'-5' RNA ligase